jgi:hypothetical protein
MKTSRLPTVRVEERVRNRKSVRVTVVQVWGVRVLVG